MTAMTTKTRLQYYISKAVAVALVRKQSLHSESQIPMMESMGNCKITSAPIYDSAVAVKINTCKEPTAVVGFLHA